MGAHGRPGCSDRLAPVGRVVTAPSWLDRPGGCQTLQRDTTLR